MTADERADSVFPAETRRLDLRTQLERDRLLSQYRFMRPVHQVELPDEDVDVVDVAGVLMSARAYARIVDAMRGHAVEVTR